MIIALVLIALFILLVVRDITGKMNERSFMAKFLMALDLFCCAIILGHVDMTISSRCGLALRAEQSGKRHSKFLCWLGTLLNLLSEHHCELAIADDIIKARNAIADLLGGDE